MTGAPLWFPFDAIGEAERPLVGDKAAALAAAARGGLDVPPGIAVTTTAYERFVDGGGLRALVLAELDRKDVGDLRWEEMWDAALRIRNHFLRTPLPLALAAEVGDAVERSFGPDAAVVVRSSAPGEDGAATSFAGLHESYVNVRGREAIVESVRRVWASLWSDAAILYRRELGLDPRQSTMGVVVQQIVVGERSGVAFTVSPTDTTRAVVEAVHGLNQGLVDGTVEPDHWELARDDGTVLEHRAVDRREMMASGASGVRLVDIPDELRVQAPLAGDEVRRVWRLARLAEDLFGAPQDVEWTWCGDRLYTLQSRPVTTSAGPGGVSVPSEGGGDAGSAGDGRAAYLSLRRSLETLERLRESIETVSLPAMAAQAAEMAATDLGALGEDELRGETARRREAHAGWVAVYERDFIPFAHGARLFGRAYNDVVRPDDPFEFVAVLQAQPMASLRRNRALEALATKARVAPAGLGGEEFTAALERFLAEFGGTLGGTADERQTRGLVLRLVERLAAADLVKTAAGSAEALAAAFLDLHGREGEARDLAQRLLDLGRVSYRLRDDDNLYLGAIAAQVVAAETEKRRRGLAPADGPIEVPEPTLPSPLAPAAGVAAPADVPASDSSDVCAGARLQARQIVGQPAGPGIAAGRGRVVRTSADLADFEAGEILVCDSIDPSMTFVVPLAAGIVERRGGMLIHGAIIAREYGLACVTGVPHATEVIATGDRVTVDGYLGIVIIG